MTETGEKKLFGCVFGGLKLRETIYQPVFKLA